MSDVHASIKALARRDSGGVSMVAFTAASHVARADDADQFLVAVTEVEAEGRICFGSFCGARQCMSANAARKAHHWSILSAQRTAVKLRPHPETGEGNRERRASPWYSTTGERQDARASHEVRPSASTACWAATTLPSSRRSELHANHAR